VGYGRNTPGDRALRIPGAERRVVEVEHTAHVGKQFPRHLGRNVLRDQRQLAVTVGVEVAAEDQIDVHVGNARRDVAAVRDAVRHELIAGGYDRHIEVVAEVGLAGVRIDRVPEVVEAELDEVVANRDRPFVLHRARLRQRDGGRIVAAALLDVSAGVVDLERRIDQERGVRNGDRGLDLRVFEIEKDFPGEHRSREEHGATSSARLP
jgi:hypothetical protein